MNKHVWKIFLMIEFILYCLMITIDFSKSIHISSSFIKYTSVILCLLFYFITNFRNKSFILAALFFAVFADYFLLFTDLYIIGTASFLLVQCFYFVHAGGLKPFLKLMPVILCAGIIFYIITKQLLITILIIYILLSITNITRYSILIKKNRTNRENILILCGIILLLLCDIHVGLHNASSYITINNTALNSYIHLSGNLIWIFYLPSQISIAFTGRKQEIKVN
jgi:hypothetical protein